jgi:hypothetical protein
MNRNLWFLLVAVAGAITGATLSAKPWMIFNEQKRQTREVVKDMQEAELERVRLSNEKSRLNSPLGRETALRKKGYIKKGETPILIEE